MQVTETPIDQLFVIEPRVFGDERGYFFESYKSSDFEKHGLCTKWVQDNVSHSRKGVLRGLHLQRGEHAQCKLVRVLHGSVYDVAVDLREGSPTYGQHFGVELNDNNKRALYVPAGFAHGFSTLSETAVMSYKCSELFNPESESGVIWNDSDLSIDWKIEVSEVSPKDKLLPSLKEFQKLSS